jgi:hypothetical protein
LSGQHHRPGGPQSVGSSCAAGRSDHSAGDRAVASAGARREAGERVASPQRATSCRACLSAVGQATFTHGSRPPARGPSWPAARRSGAGDFGGRERPPRLRATRLRECIPPSAAPGRIGYDRTHRCRQVHVWWSALVGRLSAPRAQGRCPSPWIPPAPSPAAPCWATASAWNPSPSTRASTSGAMASRGSLGGLATTTRECRDLLDAGRFDRIVVETVGVGQQRARRHPHGRHHVWSWSRIGRRHPDPQVRRHGSGRSASWSTRRTAPARQAAAGDRGDVWDPARHSFPACVPRITVIGGRGRGGATGAGRAGAYGSAGRRISDAAARPPVLPSLGWDPRSCLTDSRQR